MVQVKNRISILVMGMLIFLPTYGHELPSILYTRDGQEYCVSLRGYVNRTYDDGAWRITRVRLTCDEEQISYHAYLFKGYVPDKFKRTVKKIYRCPYDKNSDCFFIKQISQIRSIRKKKSR